MARILIVYHSQTGNTQKMALAVAEGARSVPYAASIILCKTNKYKKTG